MGWFQSAELLSDPLRPSFQERKAKCDLLASLNVSFLVLRNLCNNSVFVLYAGCLLCLSNTTLDRDADSQDEHGVILESELYHRLREVLPSLSLLIPRLLTSHG